jgi:DNA-binding MarR family transcriptional regulator
MPTSSEPDAPDAPDTSAADAAEVAEVAAALRVAVGLLRRRLRLTRPTDDLTLPESAALTHLHRGGPATPSALARIEQISPQSMGATLAGLEERGLVRRGADPDDGRRSVMSLTDAGLAMVRGKHDARTAQLAQALSAGFTPAELAQLKAIAPLLERLARSI